MMHLMSDQKYKEKIMMIQLVIRSVTNFIEVTNILSLIIF